MDSTTLGAVSPCASPKRELKLTTVFAMACTAVRSPIPVVHAPKGGLTNTKPLLPIAAKVWRGGMVSQTAR
ncbi:hypothetical protein [Bryobacter aggregatus]|uniref:hypothetical protein n=1 Tax=Bryobacter aggregatus TaxID=360054 RepID=UPI0004E1EE92|nr:hypothetical protein [Bryobacter aggregatus]